eukprot:m.142582 g.142582  ORF g.142582 m.142582 type:complete len:580 (-) comp16163_c0_seq2:2426-4165(-)
MVAWWWYFMCLLVCVVALSKQIYSTPETPGLPSCDVAVVLSARQSISILSTTLPLWLSLDYHCTYYFSIAISNVTLHAEELEIMMKAAQTRPRTYVVVSDFHQDISVERNAAIKALPLGLEYMIVADREIRPDASFLKMLVPSMASASQPASRAPLVVSANIYETDDLATFLDPNWLNAGIPQHVGFRFFSAAPSPFPNKQYSLYSEEHDAGTFIDGVGVQHTCEPHAIGVSVGTICECGLCDEDGHLHYDEDIASARDDHYYTFKIMENCGLNHVYLNAHSKGLLLRPAATMDIRDVIQFLIFRQLERDVGGQMKLERLYNYTEPEQACTGRHIMGSNLFGVKGLFNVEKEPRILRRELTLFFLNVLGFTRFSFSASTQKLGLMDAVNYLEQTIAEDVLPVNATIDFAFESRFSDIVPANNSFIQQFAPTRSDKEFPLYRSIPTTAEACLRHLLPLLWVRIQGTADLLQDMKLMKGSAIAFSAADNSAELWILVPSKASYDRAGNRLQRQRCFPADLEKPFRDYLAKQIYSAKVNVYNPADLSRLSGADMPVFQFQLDKGTVHYQFHRQSCQRWLAVL